MSRPAKKRVSTEPNSEGLSNPFAALESVNLPPGAPPVEEPPCPPLLQQPSKLGRVVLRKETAHRGGKAVIVVYDFAPHLSQDFIDQLARRLRRTLSCGGSSPNRTIELQGDQPKRIRALLEGEGFKVAGIQ